MNPGITPYQAALLVGAAVSGVLTYLAWRNRPAAGAEALAGLMLAVTEWSLGNVLELASESLPTKILWAKIQYPGIVCVPVMWFIFSLHYAGRAKWLPRQRIRLLFVLPIVTVVLTWSNEAHHLLWTDLSLVQTDSFVSLVTHYGTWFWVHSAYSYLLLTVGTVMLTRAFLRLPRLYLAQARALAVALLVPWLANVLYIFYLSGLGYPDPTPFSFILSGLALVLGLQRFRLLDLVPVARAAVVESMRDGVIVLDTVDRIVDLNPSAEGILGCVASEVIGRPISQVFSECFGLEQGCQSEALDDREIVLGEAEDRWCFHLQIGPLHKDNGHLAGRLVVLSDTTERRRAEDELRGAHDQLDLRVQQRTAQLARANRALQAELAERKRVEQVLRTRDWAIRSSISAMALADLQGHLDYVNPAFVRLWGHHSEKEVLGRSIMAFWQDRAKAEQVVEALSRKGHWIGEMVAKRKDGSPFDVQLAASVVADEGGKPICMMASLNDITERKHLEQQLRQATKMEAIGQLAGGVAHEFNNLLTVINGYSDLLLDGLSPNDPTRQSLKEIRDAGTRATTLTRQLLTFSRRQVQKVEVTNLNDVVRGVAKMLRPVIGEEIDLDLLLAKNVGHVTVDRGQIEQVVMNLAVNARDAMSGRGTLTIETRNAQLGEEHITQQRNHRTGRYVVLTVSDNGYGMTQEVQKHLFEPFFTTKEPGKGTGLGLATVYGIVEQSGGMIKVESEPGQGTTFTIYLPRVAQRPMTVKRRALPAPLPRGQETILIVEDEDNVRGLAVTMLQRMGYAVLEADSGPKALSLFQQRPSTIDLALLDVVMPQMSGHDLAQRLQADHAGLEVVYMSGYTDSTIASHGVLRPGVSFIQKPFTMESLARKVRQTLDDHRQDQTPNQGYRSPQEALAVAEN